MRCTLSALPYPVSASTISGCRDAVADQRQGVRDFRQRHEADVGTPEPRVGDARARDVERRKARVGRERGGEAVVDAGREDDLAPGQQFPQR